MEAPGGQETPRQDDDDDTATGNATRRRRRVVSTAKMTLSAASRLLRRKIPQSGHLMLPKRMWMQTVPTQDCEVVLVLAAGTKEATLQWLLTRMRTRLPEVTCALKSHVTTDSFALYLSASYHGLIKGGEEMGLVKRTKTEYGGGLRELSHAELGLFQGVEDGATFFSTLERQSIVLHLLHSLRAVQGDAVEGTTFREGQAIIPKFESEGLINGVLPLHDYERLERLRTDWVQAFFHYQPIEAIQEYFGSRIAIYFAWLGHYTAALTIPAFIGLLFWVLLWGRDQALEDKGFVLFALLNVVWASMWLEGWKRRSAALAYNWGTLDAQIELFSEPRPHFTGDLRVSGVTGRLEPEYPAWRRNLVRYLFTLPIVVASLFAVFVVMLLILQLQDMCDAFISAHEYTFYFSYAPKILMALTISAFDEAYSKVAVWLNDLENYRTEESYQNHLIIKLAVFRFVNSFLSLFYIAFYLQDMERLKEQLAALLLTRQVVGNIRESCIPYLLEQLKLAKLSFDLYGALSPSDEDGPREWPLGDPPEAAGASQVPEEDAEDCCRARDAAEVAAGGGEKSRLSRGGSRSRIVSQAEVECNMSRYEGTFEDYLEMFIQFGYVTLFSSAFPLAATCAFLNNLIEIRSDAFKLCCVFQRPFGIRAQTIGVWQDAMELMGVLGIMVNCMLIGLSGQVHRMFPHMSTAHTILLIIVLEHAMIALKYGISYAIPDLPEWVAAEMAKVEFRRREALRRLSSSSSPPYARDDSQPPSPSRCVLTATATTEYVDRGAQTDAHAPEASSCGRRRACGVGGGGAPSPTGTTDGDDALSPSESLSHGGSSFSEGDEALRPRDDDEDDDDDDEEGSSGRRSLLKQRSNGSDEEDSDGGGGKPFDSLPTLSSSSSSGVEKRARLFRFSPDGRRPPAPPRPRLLLEKPAHYAHLASRSAECVLDPSSGPCGRFPEEAATTAGHISEEGTPEGSRTPSPRGAHAHASLRRRPPPPAQAAPHRRRSPSAGPPSAPPSGGESGLPPPPPRRKPPMKFLKRAQSLSYVFKRAGARDKRKKASATRDDYYGAPKKKKDDDDEGDDDDDEAPPKGEMALVPLEKLVAIDDIRMQPSLSAYSVYGD